MSVVIRGDDEPCFGPNTTVRCTHCGGHTRPPFLFWSGLHVYDVYPEVDVAATGAPILGEPTSHLFLCLRCSSWLAHGLSADLHRAAHLYKAMCRLRRPRDPERDAVQ